MKLGTKGQYAVMAMVDLAQSDHNHPVTLSEMAERQEISLPYLEQLFAKLRRHGLVKSVRGPGGGFVLSKPAQDIYLADIMTAVDESIQTTRCHNAPAFGCRPNKARCATHELWAALGDHIQDFLTSFNLDDIRHNKFQQHIDMTHKRQATKVMN